MERWSGKVAIVTGASSGIGAAIATALVDNGLKVVGAARRMDKLEELSSKLKSRKGQFYPFQCDLEKEEDILKMFQWVEKELGGVDVLVNNAAALSPGSITEATTESYRKVLNINVIAVAICVREAVRLMKKRKTAGHILNINSLAGHYAESIQLPLGLYPASKYALTAMTMAIRHELNAEKVDIKVTSVSPGAVKTEMIMQVGLPDDIMKALPMLDGTDISDAVVYALSTPPTTQVCELIVTPHEGRVKDGDSTVWRKPQQTQN